jgi:SRSO17 transposase
VSRHGHAFIDRALYLPKGWTDDPARLAATCFHRSFLGLAPGF